MRFNIFRKSKTKKGANNRDDIKVYNPKKIYLLTTEIISDYDDGSGCGPKSITQYYLATKDDEKYYELFSNVEITFKDNSNENVRCFNFNIPYIEQVESIVEYVNNPNELLTAKDLFYFITLNNIDAKIV